MLGVERGAERRARVHPVHERQRDRPDGRARPAGVDHDRDQRPAGAARASRRPTRPASVRSAAVRRAVARPGPDGPSARDSRQIGTARPAGVRDDRPDLHDDHPVRHLGRHERRRGEVVARDGGHPQRGDAVPAAHRQGARASGRSRSVQYVRCWWPASIALLAQGSVARLVLGDGSGGRRPAAGPDHPDAALPSASMACSGSCSMPCCTPPAGSLVSRQEDVNPAVMPMTLVSTAGYMVAVYAATGLLDIRVGLDAVALAGAVRQPVHDAEPDHRRARRRRWEVGLSVAILVVTILGCALGGRPDLRGRRAPVRPAPGADGDLAAGPVRHVTRPTREPATDASGIRAG